MDNQTSPAALLKWSAQLRISRTARSRRLIGDKINLPASALEALLSAASKSQSRRGARPNYLDSFSFEGQWGSGGGGLDSANQWSSTSLPHPLTFRLVNPANGNVAYAGVREFSAEEDEVDVGDFLRYALGLSDVDEEEEEEEEGKEGALLTVHFSQLPKGTAVRLRPLEAGYDADDWKALLERHMRNTFTTLARGGHISVPSGKEEYRFLVDTISPEGDAVCIVDTDLEVDIEALDEQQARETLKRRLEKNSQTSNGQGPSQNGGDLEFGRETSGAVLPGSCVDFALRKWDRSKDISIVLDAANSDGVDLFVSPLSSYQRSKPRGDEHVFAAMSGVPKVVNLRHNQSELGNAEALLISAAGYASHGEQGTSGTRVPIHFSICVRSPSPEEETEAMETEDSSSHRNKTQCMNCYEWVSKDRAMYHEAFCYRHLTSCPKCRSVFDKNSDRSKNHWHCEFDDSFGNTPESHRKHTDQVHAPKTCAKCGYQARNMSALAQHRTSTCPEKIILCQFCHLLVPQRGPDDPDPNEPEVLLSGLTPHEISDGARTTECHQCNKIVRLRDLAVHMRHHDLERLTRARPRTCRNANCGRTLDGLAPNGNIRRPATTTTTTNHGGGGGDNELGMCDPCFGPLYSSAFDPDMKALRRRVERRLLTQFLTGCGQDFCRNDACRTAREYSGLPQLTSKEALAQIRPILARLVGPASNAQKQHQHQHQHQHQLQQKEKEKEEGGEGQQELSLSFCVDEQSQKRRILAGFLAAEKGKGGGYDMPWCIAAMEYAGTDVAKARSWLESWAPTRDEEGLRR